MVRWFTTLIACTAILGTALALVCTPQMINRASDELCRIVGLSLDQMYQGSMADEHKSRDAFSKSGPTALNAQAFTPPLLAGKRFHSAFGLVLRSGFVREIFKPPISPA